jgi:hypothetical protein
MQRLVLFATVAMAVLYGGTALAQDRPLDARLLMETRKFSEKPLPENDRKDSGGMASTLKEHHVTVQIFDVLKYIEEKRGKIPLYSVLENTVQVELGLFGYFGVRWRF